MRTVLRLFAVVAFLAGAVTATGVALAAEHGGPATLEAGTGAHPGSEPNPMHPAFAARDEAGELVARSGRPVSADRTCGACHDAAYIASHQGEATAHASTPCVRCHVDGGQLPTDPGAWDADGKLRREAIRISSPRDANCASCHGIVHTGTSPVVVPRDFERTAELERSYRFTLETGALFSAQNLSDSFLNLAGKASRTYPWDVHARRQVRCVDCHYATNSPTRQTRRTGRLPFLSDDPRRIALADFLHRPDHRLAAAACTDCHDPDAVHEFLPYKARHLAKLECQACHVPQPMAPAARMIDATTARADGAPLIAYRGHDDERGEGLNAEVGRGYAPLLLPVVSDAAAKLGPFNAVERFFWASAQALEPVSPGTVRAAYLDGAAYRPEVVALFDVDRDGTLSSGELRLDSDTKRALVAERLRSLGVAEPEIRHEVTLHHLDHGVASGALVERDCELCHAASSRLAGHLDLGGYAPYGTADPTSASIRGGAAASAATLVAADGTLRIEARGTEPSQLYVFGLSRATWSNRLGLAAVCAVLAGVLVHAALRVVSHRGSAAAASHATRRLYVYGVYERVWHWLMAASILALIGSGLAIQFGGLRPSGSFPAIVRVHNFFALVLTVNAWLSLFYHLASGAIRQFIPPSQGLAQEVAAQARYYARGIFLGQPAPGARSEARKLNPLQQLTYLALLNVLFPFQVLSGVVIWGASRWPALADALGGLATVAPLHNLGSWLFIAFFVLHLYLTTTGHTVLAHIRAMVDGYEEVEAGGGAATGGSHE